MVSPMGLTYVVTGAGRGVGLRPPSTGTIAPVTKLASPESALGHDPEARDWL